MSSTLSTTDSLRPLSGLAFDNSYARLGLPFGVSVTPTPLPDPVLVHFNRDAALLIDLDPAEGAQAPFLRWASGAEKLAGTDPVAMLYAGHQFGVFVPQLGDGRAMLLGEVVNAAGDRWDLHLKGSGPTPFSRGFDGRSVLRSAIREYLCGEALHALGVPTTRALCVVGSPEPVQRETAETAASIIRMAPTHVRIGSFEVFAARQQPDFLRTLAEYTIDLHFAEFAGRSDRYLRMLETVARRTAGLMAAWQGVGFVHGVMNTDNFSISGLTLDYGPYAFMEGYDPGFTPNHTDSAGRYAYDQQPAVGQWNVGALAQALLPLIPREEAIAGFDAYVPAWEEAYAMVMRGKLGLQRAEAGDAALLDDLLQLMYSARSDWTVTWRALGGITIAGEADQRAFAALFSDRARCDAWLFRYRARVATEAGNDAARQARMDAVNPMYVLRTWIAQEAIVAAQSGDFSVVDRLMTVLRRPYEAHAGCDAWASAVPPAWAGTLELSCSS